MRTIDLRHHPEVECLDCRLRSGWAKLHIGVCQVRTQASSILEWEAGDAVARDACRAAVAEAIEAGKEPLSAGGRTSSGCWDGLRSRYLESQTHMNQAANRASANRDIGSLVAAELFYPDIIGVNSGPGQRRLKISVHLRRAVVYGSG